MFSEDLSVFLDDDEFATTYTISKNGVTFNGIYDEEYVDTNSISGYKPTVRCTKAIADQLERDDLISDGTLTYKFILSESDGTGMSKLVLEANDP